MSKHGTRGTYVMGCRCSQCRAANTAYMAKWKAGLRKRGDEVPHGTLSGYANWRCRCDACKRVQAKAFSRWYWRSS